MPAAADLDDWEPEACPWVKLAGFPTLDATLPTSDEVQTYRQAPVQGAVPTWTVLL